MAQPANNRYHDIHELMEAAKSHGIADTLGYVLQEKALNHESFTHPSQLLPYLRERIMTQRAVEARRTAHNNYDMPPSEMRHDPRNGISLALKVEKLKMLETLCDGNPRRDDVN